MDLARVRREIAEAQGQFSYVESHQTASGSPYVLAAMQTSQGRIYTLAITFPDAYPYAQPSVVIRQPTIRSDSPHRFADGKMCYIHHSMWNPGRHTLSTVLMRAAKWLSKYEVWLSTGRWPGAQIKH